MFEKSCGCRSGISTCLLDDVEVDETLGSLNRLSDKICFKTALDQHNAGLCMNLFKVYCIGRQFMTFIDLGPRSHNLFFQCLEPAQLLHPVTTRRL